ncbi:acyltransferase [Jongsikchunia kroppenstedtii]|uniref:acyltransferase n=1 Tax=Jongsikchunia kroppenstedtii TaxID=1121721 RepID=UPI00039A250A|nr:acyltransferase [Jongsikchunia kroppenstedtii]
MRERVAEPGFTVLEEVTASSPDPLADTRNPRSPTRTHTADFVRVVLFTFVVVAHSVDYINTTPDVVRSANLVGTLCHLTRYGFVAVTLFVLVTSMRGRATSARPFWRRRFGLVLWPYLTWTLIYSINDIVLQGDSSSSVAEFFRTLGVNIVTGDGKYQLYFLLISMQIYLIFPMLMGLLRRTEGHHWWVLSAAAVIQMIMFVVYQYLPRPQGQVWTTVYDNAWKTLPMYAWFIAIGALAAYHHARVDRWLRAHVLPLVAVAAVGTTFSVMAYLYATSPGTVPLQSNTPWNPATLPWLLSGLVLLWLLAMAWNDHRGAGRGLTGRVVTYATPRAFGVFAVHPLILDLLARFGFLKALEDSIFRSSASRTTVLVLVVLTLSILLTDLIMRTPVSRILVARSQLPLPSVRSRAATDERCNSRSQAGTKSRTAEANCSG